METLLEFCATILVTTVIVLAAVLCVVVWGAIAYVLWREASAIIKIIRGKS